ncbi:peroxiredoxin [Frondihabitans sp. PhB188]|uniref:peroxiredoxin-like family protein n=1 Tax=Frondihabitans sp. PhB188 TaxID=2485200 RepID=UPI000F479AC3|nr:peroxiredoxin-like family protein [Frondihabitans sp. PhB188]ROQ37281.1 peroxiredoxin [Frondihabitans sp. PhB188]
MPSDTRPAETTTIADQVATFNEGFTAQIGPRLTAVFDDEQAVLTASGTPDGAVEAGDALPDAELVSTTGEPVRLADALGADGTVVVFYRGSWCPYCNLTLKHYQEALLPQLRERGIELLAISPQTPEASELAITNGSLEFTVLSDPGNTLVRSLGILTEPTSDARAAHTDLGFDVADSNADATGDIPFPTVLVVAGDGTVVFADVHVDYTTRTEVPTIVEALALLPR